MIITAEISSNHLGSLDRACLLVEAAAEAGADAVKFQTFTAEHMVIRPHIIESGPWKGRDLRELYKEAETPREWHPTLFELADSLGMVAFSTPFDLDSLDFLESIHCPWYKISSFEIVDLELIRACAATKKPLFISTGMATLEEINQAAEAAQDTLFTFLKCTSAYPTSYDDCHLNTLSDLKRKFGSVGLSDHTKGLAVPIAATALGATFIEKHLTLSNQSGLDANFSLEPHEFKQMVNECRNAELAMGTIKHYPSVAETSSFALRRSLYFAKDMKKGDILTKDCVVTARPNLGAKPNLLPTLLNRPVLKAVSAGTPLTEDMLARV